MDTSTLLLSIGGIVLSLWVYSVNRKQNEFNNKIIKLAEQDLEWNKIVIKKFEEIAEALNSK